MTHIVSSNTEFKDEMSKADDIGMLNPMFLMFWFWSATFDAMQFAASDMLVVKPPAKLVLIRGGKR